MTAPRYTLRAGDATLQVGERPWLMGIVNASPDSFSDAGERPRLADRIALGEQLLADGADIVDVGGESATTGREPVAEDEEIERVVPLVRALAGELGALVSVDTYKPGVARAAIAAGARIVNDVSGLRDPGLARVCAETGAALVLMHTAAPPRTRRQDPDLYGDDVMGAVLAFLRERMQAAMEAGVETEQLILDPGPDFTKTPAQTIRVLGELDRLHELGRPLLLAISRKDFIGAVTGRPPRGRLAGTLAALADGVRRGGHIFRVHDVQAAADYLAVAAALRSERPPPDGAAVPDGLRHEPRAAGAGVPGADGGAR